MKLLAASSQAKKRVLDLVLGSVLLVLAVPAALLIMAAIALETRGPVLFRHTRMGKGNRSFRLLKFRSMTSAKLLNPDELKEWSTTYKLRRDPRVTRVGKFLRRSSLDELPQLWNVLRGEMSLVGPRPIVEAEIGRYGPAYDLYSQASPGLTGLWQVSGRNDLSYSQRVELDRQYIRDWSILLDLSVLVKTVGAVISGRGAY